ncbi:hypothetical protein [Yersinia ruckeri]|uniref:hypothetical protein n=1 Tax=Yersinia ruckeri TaxID=29486 RepID=UPI000BDE5DA1|nr:hypothetical protein [Yersinia ruckeri]MCK8540463.1 hypothetical protein [Yersinia ruckeri]MCK8572499.1 hypothetical protein [Yersinia ruckeri]MCK8575962.1 hypothetical protein [Yersinia ruckeri]MCK8579479.1 hypothetical protein [Yersinia ruckeri]MCK8582814.1 hypothetical protein [Yersinia ruckeri]
MQDLQILLSPGSYFHHDHMNRPYHGLSGMLQAIQNQYLIEKFQLPLPEKMTSNLPPMIKKSWGNLHEIAWGLGLLSLDTTHCPYFLSPADVEMRKYVLAETRSTLLMAEKISTVTPNHIVAAGAVQIIDLISLFDPMLKSRSEYMFSNQVRRLLGSFYFPRQPYNVVEKVCHYVGR